METTIKTAKVKVQKTFIIEKETSRTGRVNYSEGTLEELIQYHSYTLECGASYQHEKGNAKINSNPKSVSVLVKNLNNAVNNSASNGYAGIYYKIVTEKTQN